MRVFRTAVPSLLLLLLATPAAAGEADASDDAKARGLHRELRLLNEELDSLRDAPVEERRERSLVIGERLARWAKRTRGLEGRVAEDTAEWIRALRTSFLRLEDEERTSVSMPPPFANDSLLPRAPATMEDLCAQARLVGAGTWEGDTPPLTLDSAPACFPLEADGWFRYRAETDGWVELRDVGSISRDWSVHESCGAAPVSCDGFYRLLYWYQEAGTERWIRAGFHFTNPEQEFSFTIGPTAVIEGRVTDLEGSPIGGIEIIAARDYSSWSSISDSDGRYRIIGLSSGSHHLFAIDPDRQWVGEVWPEAVCHLFCHEEDGTPMVVEDGETIAGVDFALGRVSSISGSLVKASNGRAGGGTIRAFDSAGRRIGFSNYPLEDGTWTVEPLGPGDIYLLMDGDHGVPSQLWPGIQCEEPCDPLDGEPVAIGDDEHRDGFEFVADDSAICLPDEETLCVPDYSQSRFRTSIRLETSAGGGLDRPASLLDIDYSLRGGLFYFFEQGNPEVLAKVLNGCTVNDHFWVFYAAATSLGFELTVEDVATGRSKTYFNPDGMSAETVTDIEAFPCF